MAVHYECSLSLFAYLNQSFILIYFIYLDGIIFHHKATYPAFKVRVHGRRLDAFFKSMNRHGFTCGFLR
jgi:hypothetical protein